MPFVTIRNKDGEILEEYEIKGSFLSWVKEECATNNVQFTQSPPYTATLNGNFWDYSRHDSFLKDNDQIDVTIEPKSGLEWVPYVIALLAAAYSYYAASNIPTNYQDTSEPGESIYGASANANSISPSGIIREMAGEQHIYPDLICPPHRKYIDNEEFLFLNLCLTRGFADVGQANLYISETPVRYYEGDIEFQIKDPGQDITNNIGYQNWFQSKEVSGLRLTTATGLIAGDWTLDANGDQFTSYLNGLAAAFPFSNDEDFEIVGGSNPGLYRVDGISGASNEIATVVGLEYASGDTGRLEVLTQQTVVGRPGRQMAGPARRIFNSTGSPVLNVTTGEAFTEWKGLNGGVNWEGPFLAVPPNETTRYGEYDISFPQGLVQNIDGDQENRRVRVEFRWRDYGTSAWNQIIVDTEKNTYEEIGRTIEVDYGSEINPEIMFRRTTRDSDSINISDIVQVDRIKHRLESPTSYSDVTTIQMKIRGTNALASTAENRINVRNASRKLPTLQEIQDAANGTPFDLGGDKNVSTSWQTRYSDFRTSYVLDFGDPGEEWTNVKSISVSTDGLNAILLDAGLVRFFILSNAFDFSSAQFSGELGAGGFDAHDCRLFNLGNKVFTTFKVSDPSDQVFIRSYDLSTAYNPKTASINSGFELLPFGNGIGSTSGMYIASSTKYWVGIQNTIRELVMGQSNDLATSSYTNNDLDVSSDIFPDSMVSFYFGDSLSRLYVLTSDARVFSYIMSSPGDLSTASLDSPSNIVNISGTDINVFSNHLIACIGEQDKGESTVRGFAKVYDIPETINIRRSRSMVRFLANAIYDAIGSDALGQLDFDALNDLDVLLESRDDYLDAEFIDETTLWEALKIMCRVGYCEPTIRNGVLELIRTTTGSDFTNLYTPDVMIGDGLQVDSEFYGSQEPDGVDIEYFNLDTYTNEIYEFRLPGDLGLRPKRLTAVGIGTEEKAFRLASRERRRLRAKPNTYSFTTELDALNSTYGDPIAVASDIFGGQYGQVTGVSGSVIDLDFDPKPISGTIYATFRNPDGSKASTHTVTLGPSSNQLTLILPSSPDFILITDENQEPNLVTIGSEDTYIKRAIVRRISPSGDNEVQVTAEEYVSSIYTDDDNSPS